MAGCFLARGLPAETKASHDCSRAHPVVLRSFYRSSAGSINWRSSMRRVILYSLLLVVGMGLSQLPFAHGFSGMISTLTMIFLAYIMIEVGMEFEIDKSRLSSYALDYSIAMGAAAVPWLCAA